MKKKMRSFFSALCILQIPKLTVAGFNAASVKLPAFEIPSYVLEYAPLVWLHSEERYNPSGIDQHLEHTTPMIDREPVQNVNQPLTLDNLDQLNGLGNTSIFLTSKEGIDADPQPSWFEGAIVDEDGQTQGAVTSAIIVHDKGNGTIDAFYFYFYSYNQGNTVLGMEFGDHVGDWEHNMVRFQDGEPQAIWYSQHSGGQAFTYEAAEKQGVRPIAYSAKGSHAIYSISGDHDHTIPHLNLPGGFVVDHTDQGTLWDPILNAYMYSYDSFTQKFQPYDSNYPVAWLNFNGQWGDDKLPDQPSVFGQTKYSGGPNGPKFKKIDREKVCPEDPCTILPFRTWRVAPSAKRFDF